jgi:hypothetical protein
MKMRIRGLAGGAAALVLATGFGAVAEAARSIRKGWSTST